MIKVGHKPIANALSKIMLEGIIVGEKRWVSHLPVVLMVERTIIRISTRIIPFHILYKYNAILSIKLDVLIWQILV